MLKIYNWNNTYKGNKNKNRWDYVKLKKKKILYSKENHEHIENETSWMRENNHKS